MNRVLNFMRNPKLVHILVDHLPEDNLFLILNIFLAHPKKIVKNEPFVQIF